MKRLWLPLVLSCITAHAAEVTLFIPQISKDQTASADGDPLHARYGQAWANYEKSIARIIAGVTQALDSEFNKAADSGNLDSADKWDKKKKAFLDTRTVVIEVPDKPKRPAPKKPQADTQQTFEEILELAQRATDTAFAALKSDYESLVREYTKARNLDRAKQLREEMVALDKNTAPPPARPRMVEAQPESKKKPAMPSNGLELQKSLAGTAWKNQTGFTFEWDAAGNLWHCKDGGRTPVKVIYTEGTKCRVEFINKARHVLVFKPDFTAFEQYGENGDLVQSAIRLR